MTGVRLEDLMLGNRIPVLCVAGSDTHEASLNFSGKLGLLNTLDLHYKGCEFGFDRRE